jgi:hypothetical protein
MNSLRQGTRAGQARELSNERVAIVEWAERLGAITAPALAIRDGATLASARAKLAASARDGLLSPARPLTDSPALYTPTRTGLRASGVRSLGVCRVSASNAAHLAVCASVAAALERSYPDHRVEGERELRRAESALGAPLASARLNAPEARGRRWHRPDLVLHAPAAGAPPTAVEVELTVKAPQRLEQICRAWARARCVAGVLYLAPASVEGALARAIARAQAAERIVVVPLAALLDTCESALHARVAADATEASQAARTVLAGGQPASNGGVNGIPLPQSSRAHRAAHA